MNTYDFISSGVPRGPGRHLGCGIEVTNELAQEEPMVGGAIKVASRRGRPNRARLTDAALEAHYRLVPAVERCPRNSNCLLGDISGQSRWTCWNGFSRRPPYSTVGVTSLAPTWGYRFGDKVGRSPQRLAMIFIRCGQPIVSTASIDSTSIAECATSRLFREKLLPT